MSGHWGLVEEDAARLAAALERLARLRPAKAPVPAAMADDAALPDPAELAFRLDALIAELRGALGKDLAKDGARDGAG
jgi:hypothetical protein